MGINSPSDQSYILKEYVRNLAQSATHIYLRIHLLNHNYFLIYIPVYL